MIKALKPYSLLIFFIFIFSVGANILSLFFPKKLGEYIDLYNKGNFNAEGALLVLGGIALIVLLLTFIQSAIASYASEKIGLDLRNKLVASLKDRSFKYMRSVTGGRLITVMTSDVDAVKNLVASGIVSILTAAVTLVGVVIFLVLINLKLALLTLSVIPLIILVFGLIFGKIGALFGKGQINLDDINKTINESIIASALVRVLNATRFELQKFDVVNKLGTKISQDIVTFFAGLIPIITLLSNFAVLIVLWYGGSDVIKGNLSIGEMSAFFSYTSVFIWPFFILSFAGTFVSRAQVSLKRINEVLDAADDEGYRTTQVTDDVLKGHIIFDSVTLKYGEKEILKDISFEIMPHTRTAIIGPTGAGKTELFYLLAGLAEPTEGEITVDGKPLKEWNSSTFLSQVGMVFQDSIIFNTSFKENILFKSDADQAMLSKAIDAAELSSLVKELPQGIDTNVSERGTSLSGGQKQRLMLARALSLNPKILLLDDFTSRVDAGTEERILKNINEQFGGITLISITQKIEPIRHYDHIIVLMEGELIAQGTHDELIKGSLEYRQIYESQQSTESH